MNRFIVTAGQKGADADVLGCAVAYAEILRLEGRDAVAVILGVFTASVTKNVLAWDGIYEKTYESHDGDEFVLVDISEPDYFASFVDTNRIVELYDHRLHGQEERWREQLGTSAHVEAVGSCATLIWEQVVERGHSEKLSLSAKRLLFAAIVSNTLNFKARVTTERDICAYEQLKRLCDLPDDWIPRYFEEQEIAIRANLPTLLAADTKVQPIADGTLIAIAQLELWDASAFVRNHRETLEKIVGNLGASEWFITLASIQEGKNYLLTRSATAEARLTSKLGVTFNDGIAETSALMMRKELIAALNV
jgi:inorganic pyrophosphatase/exopolyphosphatase